MSTPTAGDRAFQRFLTPRQEIQGANALARRLNDDLHPALENLLFIGQAKLPPPASKELWQHLAKRRIDAIERLSEACP